MSSGKLYSYACIEKCSFSRSVFELQLVARNVLHCLVKQRVNRVCETHYAFPLVSDLNELGRIGSVRAWKESMPARK